jgi:hypothetical protein
LALNETTPTLGAKWVRYGEAEAYAGYLAWPVRAALPLPSVIVLHDAVGVDAHIEDVARRIAIAGCAVLVPHLAPTSETVALQLPVVFESVRYLLKECPRSRGRGCGGMKSTSNTMSSAGPSRASSMIGREATT